MSKIIFVFVIFTILPNRILSQQQIPSTLKGKVVADANATEGIYIINLKTEKATVTDENGYFFIEASVCDTLMFSSIQFKGLKIELSPNDFSKGLLIVKMKPIMNQLKEVLVFQYKNINAVALGIIPKGQRSYTAAERRLKAATGYDARIGLNTSLSIDPLLNLFSGRAAMLRKELEVERKEILIQQIANLFDENYFLFRLKIPREYIKGFQFYIVENTSFVSTLQSKNKSMITFLIGELALKYNTIISDEKQN